MDKGCNSLVVTTKWCHVQEAADHHSVRSSNPLQPTHLARSNRRSACTLPPILRRQPGIELSQSRVVALHPGTPTRLFMSGRLPLLDDEGYDAFVVSVSLMSLRNSAGVGTELRYVVLVGNRVSRAWQIG